MSDKTPATTPDLVALDVIRSDLRYGATLAPPAFDMLLGGKSFGPVYNALEPLGLRLDDMRVEGQQPAEQVLSCYVSEGRTLVRYRFDRVEVQGSPSEVGIKTLFRLIEVAVGVVRSTSQTKIEEHTFTSGVHGRLGVGSVEDQLARHVPAKRATKVALAPSGVTFRVTSESAAGFASLERSLLVEDGVFLRVVSVQPGTLDERAACEQALGFLRATAAALGLHVREEQADADS
jgi:hypothetical protein